MKTKINFLNKLLVLLVVILISNVNAWAAKSFWSSGQWNVQYWDGVGNYWTGEQNDASTVELGVRTTLYIKKSWVKTSSDGGWTQSQVVWKWDMSTSYYNNSVANKDAVQGNQTWDFSTNWDAIAQAPNNPGNNTIYMYWRLDDYVSTSASYINFTIPGFTGGPSSKSFGSKNVIGKDNETTISFTHYGTALTTTCSSSITGTNASEFYVRKIEDGSVTVVFKPTSTGSKSATLTLTDAHSKTYSVDLSGSGVALGTTTRLYFNDYTNHSDWSADAAKYRVTCQYTSGIYTNYPLTLCDNSTYNYYADVEIKAGTSSITIDRYNPSSPYVTWNSSNSLSLSSSNPYAISSGKYTAYVANHPFNNASNSVSCFYYDNSDSKFTNNKYLVIGRDYRMSDGASNTYSAAYSLSAISNTNLFYKSSSFSAWPDATYYAVIGASSVSGTGWGSSSLSTKGTGGYTKAYKDVYDLESSSYYLASAPSSNSDMTISKISGYAALNCSITIAAKVKPVGGTYTAGASKGALSGSAKRFSSATSCGTGTSASVSVGSTSSVLIAGYTCTQCTLTVSSVANGYTFRGWYNAAGTKLSESTTYTGYMPKGNATVYAYFEEDTYTITYNNMAGATNPVGNPSSYSVTSDDITLLTPTKSGYGFAGWYSDEDCTTRVYSIANGSYGNKVLYAKWLTPHEPGYYVTNSPAYNVALTTYSSLKYELYRYGVSSPNFYVCAGETPTTSSASYNFLNGNKTGSTYNWDANSWIGHTNVYGVSSGSLSAKNEFPAKTAGTLSCRDQQGFVLCIKGYKQFSYWAQDNDDSGANEKQFKVYFNGVDSTKGRAKTSGGTIRRYTLDSTQTYVIEILGNTDNNNYLYGFSMRPGSPRITSSSLSEATYDVGDKATALSVTASKLVSSGTTLSYQWYSNTTASNSGGTIITDSTRSSFIPPTTSAGTTYYYCVVSETGCNSTTSSVSGAITVNDACTAPTIEWSTSPTNGVIGNTMTVSVTSNYPTGVTLSASNSKATLTDKSVDGSTVSYTLTYVAAGDVTISASVTGDGTTYCADEVAEDDVAITVSKKTPAQYSVSETAYICSGDDATITLADSEDGVSYQLYKGASTEGEAVDGTGDALEWTVDEEGTYTVKAVASDTYSARDMSGSAVITFYDAVSIGTQPTAAVNANVSEAASLSGLALSSGTFKNAAYQWQTCNSTGGSASNISSGSAYSGYNTATLSFTPSSAGTYYFQCVVSDDCSNSETSNVVTVTAKSAISPTLSYSSSVTYGSTLSASKTGTWGDGDITYTSSDDKKVSVASDGTVTGEAVGTATITATIADGTNYWGGSATSGTITVNKADLGVTATAGTASSVTHNSATLPFTLSSTTGVASVTINVYKKSDDSQVKTISGVTAETPGSGEVTGLSAETEYYFKVKPIGDANHNDGSESSASTSFTTEAAPSEACWDPANDEDDKLSSGDVSLTTFTDKFSDISGVTSVTIETKSTGDAGGCSGSDDSPTPLGYMKVKNASEHKIITIVLSAAKNITIGGEKYGDNSGSFYLVKSTDTSTKLANCSTGATAKASNCVAGTYYIYAKASTKSINFSKLCIEDACTSPGKPSSPRVEDGTLKSTGATFSWDRSSKAANSDGYEVSVEKVSDGSTVLDWTDEGIYTKDGVPQYDASKLMAATNYYFVVRAKGADGYCEYGDTARVKFTTNTAVITYVYNGATSGATPSSATGGSVTLPSPSKTNYDFDGWYVGETHIGDGGDTYALPDTVTAYAKWKHECAAGSSTVWDFTTNPSISITNSSLNDISSTSGTSMTMKFYAASSGDGVASKNDAYCFALGGNSGSGSESSRAVYTNRYFYLDITSNGTFTFVQQAKQVAGPSWALSDETKPLRTEHTAASADGESGSDAYTYTIVIDSYNSTSAYRFWFAYPSKGYISSITWTPKSCFYVTYDGNGADAGLVSDETAYYDADGHRSALVKDNSVSSGYRRDGYEFNGWNTKADGTGTYKDYNAEYPDDYITDIDRDTTLYAQWKIVIDKNTTDLDKYETPKFKDVVVRNGATLTISKDTTVKNITVESGATLHIATDGEDNGVKLTVNSLSLKGGYTTINKTEVYDMPRVYINPKSTLKKSSTTVNFDIAVTNNYHPIAVPFRVKVSEVDYAKSSLASASIYGTHYDMRTYDGNRRANYGAISTCWTHVDALEWDGEEFVDTYLEPGRGYILAAKRGKGDLYSVVRFPMKNVDDKWTTLGEQGVINEDTEDEVVKNVIEVTAYKKDGDTDGSKTPNANKGWNLLGIPYMACYQTSADMYEEEGSAVIMKGRFDYATGKWVENKIRYVTVPTYDFREYLQYNIEDEATKLLPGWCFFVQVDTTGDLTFLSEKEAESGLPYYAPRRASSPTVKTGIILSGAGAKDKTTILVSDRYSAEEYEINADLEKMFGDNSYTLATYSLMDETRLAYNAMSNADIINEVIPIGYRAPADGEYTFSINPRYAESEAFQQVNLIDYQEGTITNLLTSDYTFATERTQNDGRFALNVIKAQEVTTDIEATGDEQSATGIQKVIINDKMYIIRGQEMYDATGKRVKGGK